MPSITELAPSPSPATTTSAVERAKSAKDAGNDHFKRKAWAEAVGCYSQAIVIDPTSAIYPLNRAQAYLNLQKFEDAERDCSRSIELDGGNSKAWFRRAVARRELADFEAAARDLFQVVKLDSKQAGPVELEMAKLRAEQKAFTARKGKGPAGVDRSHTPLPPAGTPARPTRPPVATGSPVSIPIKLIYPASRSTTLATGRPPAAPAATAPVPAPPFNPASSSPLPAAIAVAATVASSPPLPLSSTPPSTSAPTLSAPQCSSSTVKRPLPAALQAAVDGDDDEIEDAPRGLLASSSGASEAARTIFGSLAAPRPEPQSVGSSSAGISLSPALAAGPSQARPPVALPTSAYTLHAALTPLDPDDRLAVLLALPPSRLPSIVGSSLEAPLVDLLLSALDGVGGQAAQKLKPEQKAAIIGGLEGARRWSMVLMMTPRGRDRWAAFKARP